MDKKNEYALITGAASGSDSVISDLKNKLTVAMSNLVSDNMATHRMGEMQKPKSETKDL